MNELHNLRIFFTISVIWSFLLIIYDIIMIKKGLYYKWLKKRQYIRGKKYRNLSIAIDVLFAILIVITIRLMVYAGVITGKYLFFNYIFGSILVLTIPGWLIIKHMLRFSCDQNDKKQGKE